MQKDFTYNGDWPDDIPHDVRCYFACPCGRKVFFVGFERSIVFNEQGAFADIQRVPVICEFFPVLKKFIRYNLANDAEFPTSQFDIVDAYSLCGENFLCLLISDNENSSINQYVYNLNEQTRTAEDIVMRRFKFAGVAKCRIGIGTADTGYIMIIGLADAIYGGTYEGKLVASNPLLISKYPDIEITKQIQELEQQCQLHPDELYLFPGGVPLINSTGMYFFLGKVYDTTLHFDPSNIGHISFPKNGKIQTTLIKTSSKGFSTHLAELTGLKEVYIGYCSNVTQRRSFAYLNFVVPKPDTHWRYQLQRIALKICYFLIKYIGRPLLAFSHYDGGVCAGLFMKFYFFLTGPRLVPDFGPIPDMALFAYNLKDKFYKGVTFKGNDRDFRSSDCAIMMDTTYNGNVIIAEGASYSGRLRVQTITNPLKMNTLAQIALNTCGRTFPAFNHANQLSKLCIRQAPGGGCPLALLT